MYIVKWLVEGRVTYFKGIGDVTVEDVEDGVRRLHALLDMGEAPVHTVSDNRSIGKFPGSLSTLKKLMSSHPKASGWTILVQEDTATRFVSEMLTHFSGNHKLKSFTNLEAALSFLERNVPNLGEIPTPE